jgi:NAD(P)-dependent dehydrogenase (short-subunit alcohol dehydrogenase family)
MIRKDILSKERYPSSLYRLYFIGYGTITLNTAIITGSTKGIGKATAIILAKAGMNVVVCSRSQNDVDKTVQEIKSLAFFENKGGRKSKGLEKFFLAIHNRSQHYSYRMALGGHRQTRVKY